LQYLVVGLLFGGEMTSEDLREELARRAGTRSRASFSRLMARMLKATILDMTHLADGSVDWKGWAYIDRQHSYRVTDLGVILWKKAREFYLSLDPPGDDFEPVEVDEAKFAEYGPKERREMESKTFVEEIKQLARDAGFEV